MEGLRILPDEALLGPADVRPAGPAEREPALKPPPDERNLYGPKPKSYGPVIARPVPTSTTGRPVYGPRIVRNDGETSGQEPR